MTRFCLDSAAEIVKRCIHAGAPRPSPPSFPGGSFPLYLPDLPLRPPCTLSCRKQHPQPVVASLISRCCSIQTFAAASTQCVAGGCISRLSAHKLSRTLFSQPPPPPSQTCSQLQLRGKTIALPLRPVCHQLRSPRPPPRLRFVHFLCEQVVRSQLFRSSRETRNDAQQSSDSYILKSCWVSAGACRSRAKAG